MATDVARLSLAIDVTGAKRAQSAMESLRSGSVVLTRATEEQIAAQYRLNSSFMRQGAAVGGFRQRMLQLRQSFRLQKGATQQAGYQIGDFAVQVGAGQSAVVAFSQQASQLAGILGPGGAVLGAVIAIGAAVAMPFVRSMGAGEEATKSFTERLQELRDATDELTDAQVRQLKLEFKAANRERLKQITAEKENIAELREEQERYQRLIDDPTARNRQARETGVTVTVTDLRKRLKELDGQIDESRANIDTYTLAADNAAQELDELIEGTDKTGDSAEKAAEKIREMVEAAEQQAATMGLSARAEATYEAALAGANAEQILAIDTAFRRIEAYNQEQEAIKKTAKEEQERIKQRQQQEQALASMRAQADPAFAEFNRYADEIDMIEQFNITAAEKERLREAAFAQHQQRMAQIAGEGGQEIAQANQMGLRMLTQQQQTALGAIGQIFGNMAQIAEKGGKDQFETWKAMASAQAAVSTALAISNALAVPPAPVGIALAGTIGALGAVQIAQIQSTEFQPQGSFLGGGFTGTGSRSGGVDGKGGFPAILHPNETVIDHTKVGDSGGTSNKVDQTLVFQISGGGDERKMQEAIMKAMPVIREQAKIAVTQGINQGGSLSRAVGRRP